VGEAQQRVDGIPGRPAGTAVEAEKSISHPQVQADALEVASAAVTLDAADVISGASRAERGETIRERLRFAFHDPSQRAR
jgi:hypothetical protein